MAHGSGDKEFPGGHVKILFIRDGARVSTVDLEPEATVPSHHHDGPHLLVAVSDSNIRSDVHGMDPCRENSNRRREMAARRIHAHADDVGKSPAKFVTVNFGKVKTLK